MHSKWVIGRLRFDVSSSARWFSSRYACEFCIDLFTAFTSSNFVLILKNWDAMQVFEIAKAVGWVPAVADRNKTYLHLNKRIPNELKFDLNCLLFTHGKACRKCTKKGGLHITKELHDYCPLLHYCRDS